MALNLRKIRSTRGVINYRIRALSDMISFPKMNIENNTSLDNFHRRKIKLVSTSPRIFNNRRSFEILVFNTPLLLFNTEFKMSLNHCLHPTYIFVRLLFILIQLATLLVLIPLRVSIITNSNSAAHTKISSSNI